MKIWKLKDDIYHGNTRIIVGQDREKIRARFKRKYGQDVRASISGNKYGCCFYFENNRTGTKHYYIWVARIPNTPESLGDLAHEVYHLVGFRMRDRGIRERIGGEASAYYFDYIFTQALKKLRSKKKRGK